MRVKCLGQEHNTMSPARAQTRSARPRVERANHEATMPPLMAVLHIQFQCFYCFCTRNFLSIIGKFNRILSREVVVDKTDIILLL